MLKCPGQDQRFWDPEDIFESKCPSCGDLVEFWKDEPQVKCPKCKTLISNPRLDLGCAEWCKFAKECLGQVADQQSGILSTKLIEELREIAGADKELISSCLAVLSFAEKIQLNEGGNPLIVKAAAVFCRIDTEPLIREILAKNGVDAELVDSICRIIDICRRNESDGSLEFDIISDACLLASLTKSQAEQGKPVLKTPSGKRIADSLL
jgi:hypothetical protein